MRSLDIKRPRAWERAVIICFTIAAAVTALVVSRSDLDDAFYVAVAAFTSAHPHEPLLAFDPMHGDGNLPLLFTSYRFASFELFAGTLAYLLNVAAMDVMYKILPPLGAIISVFCIFLLAREYFPKWGITLGALTILLIFILGENHRSPANMMFVRMFQGKAFYLSIIVPAIYYLTARYLSNRGKGADLFLLGCTQLAAIGLSNFGMLAAPIAGFGALISNIPIFKKDAKSKFWRLLLILAIPLPYLLFVAIDSNQGASLMKLQNESSSEVWVSVFGKHQQYFIAILLITGPLLARDVVAQWRLAVPPLLLFGIYLNPFFSDFISNNITTPPVYWRMVWSFPVLFFCAASICILVDHTTRSKNHRSYAILFLIIIGFFTISLPFNTLRPSNIGQISNFIGRKVPIADHSTAERAISIADDSHSLLAPDQISGVISRFEKHPKLVNVRGLYLDILAPAFGPDSYRQRHLLRDLVSGIEPENPEAIRTALKSLDVSAIVILRANETKPIVNLLKSEEYQLIEEINGYSIWKLYSNKSPNK